MPAKKASKPKRKSSSSTLTKYSRSRPLGPELKWFDVNTPNSIVGFGSYANPSSQHCPSGTGPNQRIGRTIVVKEIEIKINMQAAWAMSEPQSLQPLASVIVSISFWTSKQTGRCPLEPTSTTHSLPVYLPKIGS